MGELRGIVGTQGKNSSTIF